MKNSLLHSILIFSLTALVFQGCKIGTVKMWKNDDIETKKKEQIRVLNDKLFAAIRNNDIASIKALRYYVIKA